MTLTFTMFACLLLFFLVIVTPTAIPDRNDDDKTLEDWMIAVIASVAGVLVIVTLIFLIYWFTIRKKADGGKEIPTKLSISVFQQLKNRSLSVTIM